MNPDEYNQITKRLQEQLDQKKSLIEFRVRDALGYALEYGFHDTEPPVNIVVEWRIRINKQPLAGSLRLTKEFIAVSAFDIAEYIINECVGHIAEAIAHPDSIPVAKITIT